MFRCSVKRLPAHLGSLAGRQVPRGDFGVAVHQLGHGDVRLGLAPFAGLLEQLAQLDLHGPLGLARLPDRISRPVSGFLPA
jgi:hypothetical protein